MKVENAMITSTFLGYEEHGILTFLIELKGNGWGVGFGNCALDECSGGKRIPVSEGLECISTILKTVGVDKWEDLKGKYVRVETNGYDCTVTKIGHILKDKWFDLDEFFGRSRQKDSK